MKSQLYCKFISSNFTFWWSLGMVQYLDTDHKYQKFIQKPVKSKKLRYLSLVCHKIAISVTLTKISLQRAVHRKYQCTRSIVLQPFFRDHPCEPVPEENFWTLWCKGRLTEADTQTIQLGATPSGLTSANLHHPPFFYRPDALPATQPTVSKH